MSNLEEILGSDGVDGFVTFLKNFGVVCEGLYNCNIVRTYGKVLIDIETEHYTKMYS
jgi:hypothetical protein